MNILVVDDEKIIVKGLTFSLEQDGHRVDTAFDGEEALDFLDVGEFDAIVMDIMMPKIDGISVLKTMRANKNSTPVLLLTARKKFAKSTTKTTDNAQSTATVPRRRAEVLPETTGCCDLDFCL